IATGMEQENVTRLRAAFPDDRPVTQTGAVVGLQNAREARFLARAEIVRRVNMQSTAAIVGLGLSAGLDLDGLNRLAGDAVRVDHHKLAFVFRAGLKIED